MTKALAKAIIIFFGMFVGGILIGNLFAIGGCDLMGVCFGLSLGAVSGLIFSALIIAYNS